MTRLLLVLLVGVVGCQVATSDEYRIGEPANSELFINCDGEQMLVDRDGSRIESPEWITLEGREYVCHAGEVYSRGLSS